MALATQPLAMRPLQLAAVVVSLSSCGVSMLEMSDADRESLSSPGIKKGETDAGTPPVVAVDAGTPPPVEEVDAGTPPPPPPVDAGVPAECESVETTTCTTSCGSAGQKTCNDGHWGPCVPPTERCDNGADDDCDGRVDHHDPECTPIVHTCESQEGGGCNGDPGYGDHCGAADNTNGCSAARFNAWCNRRNAEFPNIWDNWVHDWVSTRCDGTTAETGTQYSTWFCVSSSNDRYECTTPLVLVFDSAPVKFESTTRAFAFAPGRSVQSDWPAAVSPWLARDVNGNGRIDDGSELFGSNTAVPGGTAKHGFEALATLDGNGDGVIDGKDPQFASLRVWRDANGDRVSQPEELTSLAVERVQSLSLSFTNQPRCDARGNCERERSTFTFGAGRQGSLVDVYLRVRSSRVAAAP